MLSTCSARNPSSATYDHKINTFSNNCRANALSAAGSKTDPAVYYYEPHPVKESECNSQIPECSSQIPECQPNAQVDKAPTKCDSVDSEDLNMIDVIHGMALEEQRLADELKELSKKEKSFEQAMQLCNAMISNRTNPVQESPELIKLKKVNKELSDRNQTLTDTLADAKLELQQLKERINGPLKRELERIRRKCMEFQCKHGEVAETNTSELKNKELTFLKEQLENTCNNIADIQTINAEIRQEVLVLNYKCNKLQELLVKNKVEEINAIKKISTCTCK